MKKEQISKLMSSTLANIFGHLNKGEDIDAEVISGLVNVYDFLDKDRVFVYELPKELEIKDKGGKGIYGFEVCRF